MKMFMVAALVAATAVLCSWSPCGATEYRPTSWYGDFNDPEDAAKAPGYSFYQGVSTCAEGEEFYAESVWYDFSGNKFPLLPANPRFLFLVVEWKLSYTAGKGVISIGIDYSTDNGSTWRTLMTNTYSSGIGSLSLQKTATPLRRGGLSGAPRNLMVRAWIRVEEDCPGTIGSYGGTFYIKQIRVRDTK